MVDYSADRELIAFVVRLIVLVCKDLVEVLLLSDIAKVSQYVSLLLDPPMQRLLLSHSLTIASSIGSSTSTCCAAG